MTQIQFVPTIVTTMLAASSIGCMPSAAPPKVETARIAEYITAADFKRLVQASDEPVLVEFGVEVGCVRCDELRPQIESLAEQYSGQAKVRRINLNYDRALTSQMGVTMCPTYIAFIDGQEAFRMSYPTSGDLLAAQLDDLLNADRRH